MKILIAEDDLYNRRFMLSFLSKYGDCDVTVDGREAIEAFLMELEEGRVYDLVCLDIMMPEMDGYQVLKEIRNLEEKYKVSKEKASKVIMTSALTEKENVIKAFDLGCVAYAGKPINQEKFEKQLQKLGLLEKNK